MLDILHRELDNIIYIFVVLEIFGSASQDDSRDL